MWHGFSWKFHAVSRHKSTVVWPKLTPNSMSLIQVSSVFYAGTWHGFWTGSRHGISTAFAKKMMGFPVADLVSFLTKLPSKRHEKIHVTFWTAMWSKLTPNSMTIPCHLPRYYYLFSMLEHDMDFGQVQVMEFPWYLLRKWWDFPCGFGLILEQTVVEKTRKSLSHFVQGIIEFEFHSFFSSFSPSSLKSCVQSFSLVLWSEGDAGCVFVVLEEVGSSKLVVRSWFSMSLDVFWRLDVIN